MSGPIDRFLHNPSGQKLLILEGSCQYWLKQLHAETIDLVITDPPYESLERHRAKGTTTRLKKSKASSNEWFGTISNEDLAEVLKELDRVLHVHTTCRIFCDSETEHVLLTGYNPYTAMKLEAPPVAAAGFYPWPSWTWVKTKKNVPPAVGSVSKTYTGQDSQEQLLRDCVRSGMGYHGRRSTERVLYLEKGKRKISDLSQPDVLFGPRAGKDEYPTQKPRSALLPLVKCHGVEDGVLLDPFAGSGEVAPIAEEVYGMRSILIDVNISWMLDNLVPRYAPDEVVVLRS